MLRLRKYPIVVTVGRPLRRGALRISRAVLFNPSVMRTAERLMGAHYARLLDKVRPDPEMVVKANTQTAFEYFWNRKDYIQTGYLEPGRLRFYELVADYCLSILPPGTGGLLRVLDVGCGTGHALAALQQRFGASHPCELWGLDFAESAITTAKALLPSATFVCHDVYTAPLPAAYFDLVLCTETMEHLERPREALDTLINACGPGGTIVFTVPDGAVDTWDGHRNFWTVPAFSALLGPFGLAEISTPWPEQGVILARVLRP
jgi:SAM-dependent methyltransferase